MDDPRTRYWRAVAVFAAVEVGVAFATANLTGCASVDPAAAYEIYTNIVVRVPGTAEPDVSGEASSGGSAEPASSARPSAAPVLDYRFGGFKGGRASEVAGCRIGSLKVGSDKLTYKWLEGGCEALGAADKSDYSQTVACAFYWDGAKWVGGKFDWVSTSRTSRSFKNIKAGYNGWDAGAFLGAKRHGFCIVSKDGKKRSNFIEDNP